MAAPWNTSCLDWAERIKEGRSLIPNLPLVKFEADRAVGIFDRLRLPDVPDLPLMKDAAGDWIRDIVRALFGSWDAALQERFIREFFVLVPKKNSKTSSAAAIMVTALLVNRRPRAEFILIGAMQDVADLAFKQAQGMIEADPVLIQKFRIQEHIKQIKYLPTGAFLKIKSFDPKIVTGTKPVGVLLDELHLIANAGDADRVIGQLRGGMISQPEGFLLIITTQSERPPSGVFRSELLKARKVRDGTLQAPILPVLYEFPPDVDWKDSANWHMVTPNAGRSITIQRLIPDFNTAKETGEEEFRRWASQHLNVEIGLALHTDRWAGADHWLAAADETLTLDALLERSEVVTMGIDGGGLDDLLGVAVLGRERGTQRWLLWTRAFVAKIGIERRKSEEGVYRDLEQAGDLVIVDGLPDDITQLMAIVRHVQQTGLLHAVGVDQIGIGGIVDALAKLDLTSENGSALLVSQGWRLAGAIKTMERKLADGTLKHAGQKLMAWAVGNARVEPRANAFMITKQMAGTAKIDPLIAAFNAVSLMEHNPQAQKSIYNDPDAWEDEAQVEGDDGAAWDPEILANPRHPDWQKHRQRYEAHLDAMEAEEGADKWD